MRAFLKEFWLKTKIALKKKFYLKYKPVTWVIIYFFVVTVGFATYCSVHYSIYSDSYYISWKELKDFTIKMVYTILGYLAFCFVVYMIQTLIKRIKNRIKNKRIEKRNILYNEIKREIQLEMLIEESEKLYEKIEKQKKDDRRAKKKLEKKNKTTTNTKNK